VAAVHYNSCAVQASCGIGITSLEDVMADSRYHLAQINIGRILAELDDPIMKGFVDNLEPINALADRSPGFVWRYQTEDGNATAERPYEDDRMLLNFSVWEDVESLRAYVYSSAHVEIMKRRREWFERMSEVFIALWWVPAGHRPTVAEAVERLDHLQRHGPSAYAFTFRELYPPPDAERTDDVPSSIEDACPAP
jgi:heme-degrading monooxygenase HmoA